VRAPTEEKNDDSRDRFCEQVEQVFDHFPKYHMKRMLRDFNTKLGREDIFKPTIENESLRHGSNDSGVRVVNFAILKNLVAKISVFPHQHFHKYTWTSPSRQITVKWMTYW
jgi:hypothetical protein